MVSWPRSPNCASGLARRGSAVPQLKPGHRPPAAPPPAPPRREARNELKPPAAFRITARRTQLRRPRPGAIGDLDPDDAVPAMTATLTVSPGAPEPECRTLLPKISLTSKTATSPHGCPGPSTVPTNVRAARARSARPASVTLSRTATLAITAPALPRPPRPGKPAGQRADAGKCTLSSAANVKPRTGPPPRPCPWLVRACGPRPWPSVKQPTVHTDRPGGTHARPLCVRGHRNATVYSDPR